MPVHIKYCLCDTFLDGANNVGQEKLLFALRKHASYASPSVVKDSVKVGGGRDRHDSAPAERAVGAARLKQRYRVDAYPVKAEKHVSARGDRCDSATAERAVGRARLHPRYRAAVSIVQSGKETQHVSIKAGKHEYAPAEDVIIASDAAGISAGEGQYVTPLEQTAGRSAASVAVQECAEKKSGGCSEYG
ncbi:unnamed protein product [Sphacelaria rigidula]